MDHSTQGLPVYHQNPEVHSNSCPLSRWCHPTTSSFVVPFSSCLQSFPASESFQMSQLFASSGQNIGSFSFNISSVQFSRWVVSDSLWPHEAAHQASLSITQLPAPIQTHVHRVSDAIQPSHPLSSPSPPAPVFPIITVFSISQLFISGGQSIGASASASVLPVNIQGWFPLGWTGWTSL